MATKKVGPPVPPRPTAVSVAHALAKSRSASPNLPNGKPTTRTVIYKSPSLENTSHPPAKPPEKPPVPKPRHKSPARVTPVPLQKTMTKIEIEDTKAFAKKILNEVAEMNKAKQTLPNRPDPEGKEKDLKPVEEPAKSNLSNKAFSEMLISELTALHPSTETVSQSELTDKVEVQINSKEKRGSVSSTDVSPHGTKSRIRTSDWIEVGDNGKEVLMTSCHISLEDSGLEDEEKLDDASSGVGDSWDSVRDTEER